ncbi:MAG TPA: hypothetical protein VJU02_05555 [Nitrospiraceae bacterium]|nr:hypothetical protein [Nitrospiraceae bacterium]
MKVRTTNPTPIMAGVLLLMSVGCGAVGSPIPPERVGVNATIERQKTLESLEEKRRKDAALLESTEPEPDSALQGQDVNLPPLQPVGTR